MFFFLSLVLDLVAIRQARAIDPNCKCSKGFPPINGGGFKKISGNAGCIINYIQFEAPNGAVVFRSGTLESGGQPFSVSCPGTSEIASFSFQCNDGQAGFPVPTFASLSTAGGVTCSNGSMPLYTGTLNGNVCQMADNYTQVGYLECGADGSAPQSCATEGGTCVATSIPPCGGTTTCQVIPPPPPPPGGPWPMMFADAQHTSMGSATGPKSPKILWQYGIPFVYGLAVGVVHDSGDDVVYAVTDGPSAPNTGGFHAITHDGKPAWQWFSPEGGYMDCTPSIGSDGTIYVGETNAHAVAANTTLLWDVSLNTLGPYASSSTLGPDGTVYFATGSFSLEPFVYAILRGGSVLWSLAMGVVDANVHVPPALSKDASLLFVNWGEALHALDARSGAEVWSAAVGVECAPSIGPDGTVYCGTAAFTKAGKALWATPFTSSEASAYVAPADGRLYGVGFDGVMHCYSSSDGSVVWSGPIGVNATSNSTGFVLDQGGSLFVHMETSVYALARSSGAQQWSIALPEADASLPQLPWPGGFGMMSDGTLLFSTWQQNSWVYAVGESDQ